MKTIKNLLQNWVKYSRGIANKKVVFKSPPGAVVKHRLRGKVLQRNFNHKDDIFL